jgi:hypothetical protein
VAGTGWGAVSFESSGKGSLELTVGELSVGKLRLPEAFSNSEPRLNGDRVAHEVIDGTLRFIPSIDLRAGEVLELV